MHIQGGALTTPITLSVPPGTVDVQKLDWVPDLKACNDFGGQVDCITPANPSTLAVGGAYHVRSDRPITVYQFSPLDYVLGSPCGQFNRTGCSFTNDASLLIPSNAMTGNYLVVSYPVIFSVMGPSPGLLTVTATRDGTDVTITTSAATIAGTTAPPAFVTGVPQTITLDQGDALQLFTETGDLTGSTISATKPVQVIGGHYCTNIPAATPACDHLEESMFPTETLDTRYIVTAPTVAMLNGAARPRVVRIVATEANTTLAYNPPQTGAATTIAAAGGYIDIEDTDGNFEIQASQKVVVAEYMQGGAADFEAGDPSLTLAVPVSQYRTNYQFHAPQNYAELYINVIAPVNAVVTLDGGPLAGFTDIGSTGFQVLRFELPFRASGNYIIDSDEPVGVSVYGYGDWTSFYYPAGLDLKPIPVQ